MLYGLNKRERQAGDRSRSPRSLHAEVSPAAGRAHPGGIPETGPATSRLTGRLNPADKPAAPH